jgi:hypothetical protein
MFIENVGQFDERIQFQVRGQQGTFYFANDAVWLTVLESSSASNHECFSDGPHFPPAVLARMGKETCVHNHAVQQQLGVNLKLSFTGANPNPHIVGLEPLDTAVSYFIGNNPDNWHTNVPVYAGVRYEDVYPGVDVEYVSLNGQWQAQLVAKPWADLSAVAWQVEGADTPTRQFADGLSLVDDNRLRVETAVGPIELPLLLIDETKTPIQPKPSLHGTYLGEPGWDEGRGIAVHNNEAYVTGISGNCGWGGCDAPFVTRLNASGSGIIYQTQLNGSQEETSNAIAVDSAGAAYITDQTKSNDFPVTADAFQSAPGNPSPYNQYDDAFVVKLDASGEQVYGTYLGGSDYDYGYGLAVNASGVYVTGETWSTDFPFSPSALQSNHGGGLRDAFAARFDIGPTITGTLTLEVIDANGNDVTGLTLNAEGWPISNTAHLDAVANPLTVQATLYNDSDQTITYPFEFHISFSGSPGRFFVFDVSPDLVDSLFCYGHMPGDKPGGQYSYETYTTLCPSPGLLNLLPGQSHTYQWQVWVQPSDAVQMQIQAAIPDAETVTKQVDIPQAVIHPAVFVHGILGSMPPKNSVITQWPQPAILTGETWLDPFTRSYAPLIENLLKMGYEIDKTLFPVTYDWRQSNQLSACWLSDALANDVQSKVALSYVARDDGGNIDADVIVHSMGGMVLRAYLEDMGRTEVNADGSWGTPCPYNNDINKAVFIASPHRGFPVTYNTREGMTWEDYLSTEVDPHSEWENGLTLSWLIDNLIWPYFVVKQYEPSLFEYCYEPDFIVDGAFCPEVVRYLYSHSNDVKDGRFRGIRSLAEMLPDEDVPDAYAYLVDSTNNTNLYPHGRETNPLLDGASGLNSATNIDLLTSRVPVENIFVILTNNEETVQSYNVSPATPPTITHYFCHFVPILPCIGITYTPWPNGMLDGNPTIDLIGDDLIPEYSTDLNDEDVPLIPSLPEGNSLPVNDGGHKRVASNGSTQSAVAYILSGYAVPESVLPEEPGGSSNLFPFTSPYVAPTLLGNNLDTVIAYFFLSPVDGLVTDPLGRRVGYDPASGQVVNEIPGAFYSGNSDDLEFILIPGDGTGDYIVTTTGTSNGQYTVLAYQVGASGGQLLGSAQGNAVPGVVETITISYAPVIGQIFLEDTEADGPWLADGGWDITQSDGHAAPPAWASDAMTNPLSGRPLTLTLTTPLTLTAARQARFTFTTSSTLSLEAEAVVEISSDGGSSWQRLTQLPAGSTSWERRSLDLTPFTQPGSTSILLRFRLLPAAAADRWLVDDIRVEGLQPPDVFAVPFNDNFEGWRRWQMSGDWAWSQTSSHSASHAWRSETPGGALTLSGTISLTDTTHPQLSFWQQLDPGAVGIVEASTDGLNWTPVYTTAYHMQAWEAITVDLGAFAGNAVLFRFRHTAGSAWTIDDVTLTNAPPPITHLLPFNDDMESPETNWVNLNGWEAVTDDFHSSQTSWRSATPESGLRLIGTFDLGAAVTPQVTFWHKFDLPTGSVGTVEASADSGLTWMPVYTQTTPLTTWTEVNIDLSAYAGEQIFLAFYLREVGAGNAANAAGSVTRDSVASSTASTNASDYLVISLLPLGGAALLFAGRKRRYGYMVLLLAGLGTAVMLSGCRRARDAAALDQAMGEMELIFPAQQRFVYADMTSDARWLFTVNERGDEQREGYYHHTLYDMENNLQYELGESPGLIRRWVDDNHLAGQGEMIRVSDMQRWSLQTIQPPAGSLGELNKADHIYAIDGFGTRFALVSIDPNFPYSMATSFKDGPNGARDLEAFLSNRPHTIVMRDPRYGSSEKAYSPDGRYYLRDGGFDPPNGPRDSGLQDSSSVIYDAATDERVTEAYKSGYSVYPLAWTTDSSGIYVRFSPRNSMGQYLNHFMYKLLVPGAEKQEPPVFTPATIESSSRMDMDVEVVASSESGNSALYHRALQTTSNLGWYIDDVRVEDVSSGTPTPTATPTDTATPTTTHTPLPTATNTPLPTTTNTPLPSATPTNTATSIPVSTPTATAVPTCNLYPIALHANTIAGVAPGQELEDILNGSGPGNFGWLTWSGNNGINTLINSLTPPGDSDTYVNPYDPADNTPSVGDWVNGRPGTANSKQLRQALDNLMPLIITVPVWNQAQGQGNNIEYQISSYAQVQISDYHLPGQDRISAVYWGAASCP